MIKCSRSSICSGSILQTTSIHKCIITLIIIVIISIIINFFFSIFTGGMKSTGNITDPCDYLPFLFPQSTGQHIAPDGYHDNVSVIGRNSSPASPYPGNTAPISDPLLESIKYVLAEILLRAGNPPRS